MRGKKLSEEQKELIRQGHAEGKTRAQILREFQDPDISMHAFHMFAVSEGLDFSKKNAPLSETDREQIRVLYHQGLTRTEIGARLHRSGTAISGYAAEMGLTFPSGETRQLVEARELSVRDRVNAAHDRHLRILEHEQKRLLDHYENNTPWPTKMRGKYGEEHIEDVPRILSDDWRNVSAALAATANTLRQLQTAENPADAAARSMADRLAEALGLPKYEGTPPMAVEKADPPRRGGHKKNRDL